MKGFLPHPPNSITFLPYLPLSFFPFLLDLSTGLGSPASFMASNLLPFLPLALLLCLAFASASPQRRLLQSDSQRNIETTFPSLPSPAFQNPPPPPPSPSLSPPSTLLPLPSSGSKVRTAVAVTAASSIGLCGLLFLVFLVFSSRRRKVGDGVGDGGKSPLQGGLQSKPKLQPAGSLIVDESGLDAIYWREFNEKRCRFCHNVLDTSGPIEETGGDGAHGRSPPRNGRRIQEKPLLPAGSINSSSQSFVSEQSSASQSSVASAAAAAAARSSKHAASSDQQPLPPPAGRLKSSSSTSSRPSPLSSHSSPLRTSSPAPPAPPPPPLPTHSNAAPAPPPPPPVKKSNAVAAPSPPPPPPGKTSNATPARPPSAPPPPAPGGGKSGPPTRPPPVPPQSSAAVGSEAGQKKMKPLHWDKVNPVNAQHSMVWDKINTDGSFNFDEDIMEALFGTLVTNRKAAKNSGNGAASSSIGAPGTPTQISLLDSRKSQNIAIVLRSLALSRQDILDALVDGRGLPADVLERLTKIAPTKEEEALIREYDGNPAKLADAESFLFHILRTVSSPFSRFEAMLFRSNYELEVAHLKQSLQTLESACKELRSRGLFLKLLEAVLKAGNHMNAGTARGNAQAFNLAALCKLSDVKSTDGSTTLLHFVVEEVIQSEGKRLVTSRNYSIRQQSDGGGGGPALDRTTSRGAGSREEREKEYIKLGLPIVGGISDDFASSKKAAGIDHDALTAICGSLGARLSEIRKLLDSCGGDGFAREMRPFVEAAEEELKAARAEQARVMELVKSTTEYYQPGASKEKGAVGHPLQLFVIVRDFLNMVDKACVDIARNVQKRKPAAEPGSSSSSSAAVSKPGTEGGRKPMARFPYLPPNFMSENSRSDSSSDEDDDGP